MLRAEGGGPHQAGGGRALRRFSPLRPCAPRTRPSSRTPAPLPRPRRPVARGGHHHHPVCLPGTPGTGQCRPAHLQACAQTPLGVEGAGCHPGRHRVRDRSVLHPPLTARPPGPILRGGLPEPFRAGSVRLCEALGATVCRLAAACPETPVFLERERGLSHVQKTWASSELPSSARCPRFSSHWTRLQGLRAPQPPTRGQVA